MKKIAVLSKNMFFAEDIAWQITHFMPGTEICFEETAGTELFLIDEDEVLLQKVAAKYKEHSIVFLSAVDTVSDFADVVIKKPFVLKDFLASLKRKTLLPKIRRKECLNFKEYSLYPVKKEIHSSKSGQIVKLTEKEVLMLKYLYQKSPENTSKEELLENVWGYSAEVTTHTIETHIYRLRQKVEQENGSQLIITENSGYRLNV